ncbi:hypothetical protein QJS04_geneDACA014558 [Acorus gramineus]|uniref:Uncharacterized protein n=1 Tax=Acorus gramineus TaxID=55184 RepID=A0AAV9ATX0_ACOGR|nr:hypothetical protein QJS04_geneDACA014558 [Acorus gramineus]
MEETKATTPNMAGADCAGCGIDFETKDEVIPPHLLVDEEVRHDEELLNNIDLRGDEADVKARILAWAKAVAASINSEL